MYQYAMNPNPRATMSQDTMPPHFRIHAKRADSGVAGANGSTGGAWGSNLLQATRPACHRS